MILEFAVYDSCHLSGEKFQSQLGAAYGETFGSR